MENQSPLISIVIPFYSTKKGFLKRSIESVLKQDYQNFEIIIVDDCSPVNAHNEIVELLPNKKIKILRNKTNRHGAYSRNHGIANAQGEYIALLDADDYWDVNHLSTCIKEISNCDFIYSNIQRVLDSTITKINVSDAKNYDKALMADILLDSPPQTNSFFFRQSCYPTVKFDESLKRHQDYQFFLAFCLSEFKVKKVDVYTSYYVATEYDGKIIDYKSINQFWKKNGILTTPYKLNKFLMTIIISNLRKKNPDITAVKKTCQLLPIESIYKSLCLSINSLLVLQVISYTYYYLYLDFKKLPIRISQYVKKSLTF